MNVYIFKIKSSYTKDKVSILLNYVYKDIFGTDINFSKISKNKYGKPYYDDTFYYNISHSKNYICIAVGNSEVGIDIEEDRNENINISKRIMAVSERIINNNIINNWVIKEAYSKYKGLGMYMDFKNINSNELLIDNNLHDISSSDYYCYVYSKEVLNSIEVLIIE